MLSVVVWTVVDGVVLDGVEVEEEKEVVGSVVVEVLVEGEVLKRTYSILDVFGWFKKQGFLGKKLEMTHEGVKFFI